MNWLAHLYLSEPTAEHRLGNLLPDFLGPAHLKELPPDVMRGIECHRRIDAFTDRHPVFRRSIERLEPPHRRFGGILVDVFYDHFLAVDWRRYSEVPLGQFAEEVYESLETQRDLVPAATYARFQQMKAGNLLCSYRSMAGIELALARTGTRFRKPVDLGSAVSVLQIHHAGLGEDFASFFPELQAHVRACFQLPPLRCGTDGTGCAG